MIRIDSSKCDGCGICVEICPVRGVEVMAGKAVANERCIDCGTCVPCCPPEAITRGE
ncbi:MAG: 4Fe-4S binding protein [Candidatus Omnitrophica bacterium]|nr:4Fe-4S binding protein [Candidatus Omnitrophota bacterium]